MGSRLILNFEIRPVLIGFRLERLTERPPPVDPPPPPPACLYAVRRMWGIFVVKERDLKGPRRQGARCETFHVPRPAPSVCLSVPPSVLSHPIRSLRPITIRRPEIHPMESIKTFAVTGISIPR